MQTFHHSLASVVFHKQDGSGRRKRDAFGYMEPDPSIPDFAQCSSCRVWLKDRDRCHWLADDFKVDEDDSCILYVQGPPISGDDRTTGALTPQEVGFYDGKTRCQNCVSLNKDDGSCNLFRKLNAEFPDIFDLDEGVKPRACCNAFMGDVR